MEDKYTSQDTQLKGNPYGGVTGYRHDLTEYSLIRNTDPVRDFRIVYHIFCNLITLQRKF